MSFCISDKEKRLDEFLKTHTSEDNESFDDLVKEADLRQRAKVSKIILSSSSGCNRNVIFIDLIQHPWLFKNDCPALPASTELLAIEGRPANVDTWAYKNKNYIMYVPDGMCTFITICMPYLICFFNV